MRQILQLLTLPFLVGNLQAAEPAETLASDLLAVEQPVTAGLWLRSHPNDAVQPNTAALQLHTLTGNPFCAVSTGQLKIAGATFNRQVFFRIPDAKSLRLPAGGGPHPDLLAQCVLNEIVVRSDSAVPSLSPLISRMQNDISSTLGSGEAFQPDSRRPYLLLGSDKWKNAVDWSHRGPRWITALDTSTDRLIATGLTAAAQQIAASAHDTRLPSISQKIQAARNLALATGLPGSEIQRMQTLLNEVNQWQNTGPPKERTPPEISRALTFVLNWVKQSRSLSPDRRAAGLYSADVLLTYLPLFIPEIIKTQLSREALDVATKRLRTQLAAAGAHYEYDQLGACYAYRHNWLQEAFRVAPESLAGQQAFLFLLDTAFNPGCCWSGNGFEDVIARAPQYLREHPRWTIRSQILLAIGDAYRDKIATANGANGDPFGDAAKYAPSIKESRHQALRYYRAAIVASPGSESARQALIEAWSLEAGLPPLDTRFVHIYD